MFSFLDFMFIDHIRGIQIEKTGYYLVDLANTPDCGWEIARNKIDVTAMQADSETIITIHDMLSFGEDYCDDLGWEIMSNHKSESTARKAMHKICNGYAPD